MLLGMLRFRARVSILHVCASGLTLMSHIFVVFDPHRSELEGVITATTQTVSHLVTYCFISQPHLFLSQ